MSRKSYQYDVRLIYGTTAGGGTETKYFGTSGFSAGTGYALNSNVFVDGRLEDPGIPPEHLWGPARTRGPRQVADGTAVLDNADGGLDAWNGYAFDGRRYLLDRFLKENQGASSPDTAWDLVMEQPIVDEQKVSLYVRDAAHKLDRPALVTRFAGTNSLPNGLEGTPDDIGGTVKPRPFGKVKNWSPPCVNTSRNIFQLSVKQFATNWAVTVYVKRATIAAGVARTLAQFQAAAVLFTFSVDAGTNVVTTVGSHGFTTADPTTVTSNGGTLPGGLLTTAYYYARVLTATTCTLHPTAADASANTNVVDITSAGSGTLEISNNRTAEGAYDWCNDATSGFFIRLGSDPEDGRVTTDITAPCAATNVLPSASSKCEVHSVVHDLLELSTGAGAATVDATVGVVSLPDVGIVLDDDITILEAINQVAQSIGAGWYTNSPTVITLRQLLEPSTDGLTEQGGDSDYSFTRANTRNMRRIASGDEDRGIPAWRVNVHYLKNYTIQSAGELFGVALADVQFTEKQFRVVSASDATIKTQWPQAPEINIYTLLVDEADAQDVADRLLPLYKVRRDFLRWEVDIGDAPYLQRGRVVDVTFDRFGLDAGKYLQVLGIEHDAVRAQMSVTGWG